MPNNLIVFVLATSILAGCSSEGPSPVNALNVANDLNARYLDSAAGCANGSAAFHCNGVLVRVADTLVASGGEIERDAAAFSYLRADTGIKTLYARGAGIILSPLPDLSTAPIKVRCSFPTNAATDFRADGCGETSRDLPGYEREWSQHCDEQGIHDEQQWHAHFNKVKPAYFYMCAFRESTDQFALSIEVRKLLPVDYRNQWNEVVTTAWAAQDIKRMPFQAFFYNAISLPGKEDAQKLQREFYSLTQTLLPIVRIDLSAADQRVFSYHPQDQTYIPVK
jgi:hypothetical protein